MRERYMNRGISYECKESKDEDKQQYSLRELVGDIAGVNPVSNNFESEYKCIQRIKKSIENYIGRPLPRIKCEDKATFVELFTILYSYDGHDILSEIRKLPKDSYPLNPFEDVYWQLRGLIGLLKEMREEPPEKTIPETMAEQSEEILQ